MRRNIGTYRADSIHFLLNKIELTMTSVEEKEKLIQSGEKHYSDMLSIESAPSQQHLDIFKKATELGAERMANEVLYLAEKLKEVSNGQEIVLASLVRAGAPLGVCLVQALRYLGVEAKHYGISIVRDRGIDKKAMEYIESKHDKRDIYFVDGWTGKGAISQQLTESLTERGGYPETPQLVVLADPCGKAWLSASSEDWLIPFGIMGAPISGLISRTVWSDDEMHGCVEYDNLSGYDLSQPFADYITSLLDSASNLIVKSFCKEDLVSSSEAMVEAFVEEFNLSKTNLVKPGVAEATRAVMRRVPDVVMVRDLKDPDVQLLISLAEKGGAKVTERPLELGQYKAVTIIRKS